jgi:alpha-D-ribose 1-methylphosphonate 5-triphosphate diphosphatase
MTAQVAVDANKHDSSRDALEHEHWISDARMVLPDGVLECGSIRFEDGLIAEILEGPVAGCKRITNARGMTLIPGVVDVHGDMLEREIEPRPGSEFPTQMAMVELDKRLAAAGVTTAFAAISFAEARTNQRLRSEERAKGIIHDIAAHRDSMLVDWRVHARFEITNHGAAPILRELIAAHHLDLVSLTDHTPGQGQYRDLEHLIAYSARWRGAPREEVESNILEKMRRVADAPPSWEVVRDVARIAVDAGVSVASHDDDTAEKVDLVWAIGATLSEFPVSLAAALEAKRRGMAVIMGAPNALRGESHSGNLSALDALEAGALDILAADYSPGSLVQAAFRIARDGRLPLEQAVGLISENPAKAVKLFDRGRIAVGCRADIALLEVGDLPRVRATWRGSRVVYSDGTLELN